MLGTVKPLKAAVLVCLLAALFSSGPLSAQGTPDSKEQKRVGVILEHLPLKTSRAYRALHKAAGKPDGEILPMTKSEMWSVPQENLAGLREKAEKAGVVLRELDSGAMNALAPMQPGNAMSEKQNDMMKEAKERPSTMGVSMMGLPEPTVLEYALTRGMNAPNSDEPAPSITLKLSDTVTISARRTNVVKQGDSYIWHGAIEGTDEPVTLLWWPMGRIAGTISHAGRIYSIQSLGGGMHAVIETAPKMLPPEHAPMDGAMKKKMNMIDDPLIKSGDAQMLMEKMPKSGEEINNLRDIQPVGGTPSQNKSVVAPVVASVPEKPVTITLVIAFTKAAATRYANISKDLIDLAVAEANQSFKASGVGNVRVKLSHAYQTEYVEQGSHFDHVFKFAEKGDGVMDEIHKLRDKHRADVGVLIVDDVNGCGLAAGVAPPAERAFAVVHQGCAATTYSLAHEIGHIIGARHDPDLDHNKEPFAYGHGFVNGTKWRTLMGYEGSCGGCPRLPIWSNPEVYIQGEAAGSDLSNNARVIREQAARVAAFR